MNKNRREFLKKSGSALSMLALATQSKHFGLMSAMAQKIDDSAKNDSAVPNDYRAMVCILLAGGNDGNNLIIPNHSDANVSNYAAYAAARSAQGLAIAQNQLLPIAVPRLGNLTYGLHPAFGAVPTQGGINNGIHELWAQGRLAAVVNTGNLIRPMTKAQYQQNASWRPFQLFSHSDQTQQQQTSRADSPTPLGWGGKIADLTNAANNPNGQVAMITSIAGTQLFTLGQSTTPLAIRDSGTPLNQTLVLSSRSCCSDAFSNARNNAVVELRTVDLNSQLVASTSNIMNQAQTASNALSTFQEVSAAFPDTNLGRQLKQIARMIKKRTDLSVNRQIFFAELGGFDTHQNQVGTQTSLFIQLSQAMRAFYDEMTAQGISDKVTTFTLSDFGRTLNPAGTGFAVGSDHAWGNNMLVLGGSVIGGNIYGNTRPDGSGNYFPTLQIGGADDIDTGSGARGRWLPTTSVEQYAGTLARWFGLTDTDLPTVFPNIVNFPNNNLGFMMP
ncbi:MAG TPA: DUF1501 domain-containing protein [Pyrinomonadaceae bacterium]|nr:DUF1501 domain-containing protein [Pyrinomonadaceae bacterium]